VFFLYIKFPSHGTACEFGEKKLFVLPGAGVKPYYRRLGYVSQGHYLAKQVG